MRITHISKTAIISLVALLAVAIRMITWYILKDQPAGSDWATCYEPGALDIIEKKILQSGNAAFDFAPAYIFFLAAIFKFINHSVVAMRIAQILLDGVTVFAIGLIGEMAFSRRVAVIACLSYAFYIPAIYLIGLGQPETVLTLSVTSLSLAWMLSVENGAWRNYALMGIALMSTIFLKPNYTLFPLFFIVLTLIFRSKKWKAKISRLLVIIVIVSATAAAWSCARVKNSGSEHSSHTYLRILYAGSILRPTLNDGALMPLDEFYETCKLVAEKKFGTYPPRDIDLLNITLENWIRQFWPNPLKGLLFLKAKFRQIWYATNTGNGIGSLLWLPHFIILILASIGFIHVLIRYKKLRLHWMQFLLISYTILALMLITPLLRLTIPIMPLMLLYTSEGLLVIFRRLGKNVK